MALTYKTDQITLNAVNTDFTILTATASTTLVKNITWIHDDHNTNVILSLTKSGGTKTQIGTFSATADTPLKLWTDILPLEANDVLHLQSDHISSSDPGFVIVSYVEDTTSVAGQSIGVHTDVDITGITNGQILKWNASATEFQPGDDGGGLTNTDSLTEGSSNLYFTNARADARIAAANVTDLSDVTAAGSGSIITAAERTKLSGIATAATANDTDANLKARANHTGTQTASTISDFDNQADSRISSASVEDLNDVTDAGSGAIITATERTKLSGIATAATANDTDANLKARANHTGTQTASTISDFNTQADARIAAASFLDLSDAPASYTASQLLVVNGSGNAITLRPNRNPFNADEIEADQNRIFEKTMSTTSNKVVDIFGDALADASNANAKKFLGFYHGSDNVVLEGMVDVGAAISGASAGSPLWLGTSGTLSATAPTTADHYARVLGYYVGAGQGSEVFIYFSPSKDWIQID